MLRILFILLFLGVVTSFAQVSVGLHDTTVQRGKRSVNVYATLGARQGDSLTFTFRFDPNLIDVQDVSIPIFGCYGIQYSVDMLEVRKADVHVRFSTSGFDIRASTVIRFDLEVLAGADSVTTIEPLQIVKNGVAVTSPTLTPGRIHISDANPVIPLSLEYLSAGYPHPSFAPSFDYFTLSKGSVQFTLYNELGRELMDERLTDVEAGLHTFTFVHPEYSTLCDAPYYLRMITVNGVYTQQFIVEH